MRNYTVDQFALIGIQVEEKVENVIIFWQRQLQLNMARYTPNKFNSKIFCSIFDFLLILRLLLIFAVLSENS